MMRKLKILMLLGTTGILSSCDLSQIPGLDKRLNIEDSKAIGAACRHSGRALEDCFTLNPTALQSGVFEGWRDMNDYMVANKIETVEPQIQSSHYKPGAKDDAAHGKSAPESAVGAPAGGVARPSGSAGGAQAPAAEEGSAQARPRWQPGQSSAGSATAPGTGVVAPAQAAGQAHSPPSPPAAISPVAPEGSAAAPATKPDSPARPWERKSGTKNTT